jgi:hypothetical protein
VSSLDAAGGGGDAVADFSEKDLEFSGLGFASLGNVCKHGGAAVRDSAQLCVSEDALHLLLCFPDRLHGKKESVAMVAGPPGNGGGKFLK